MPRSRFVKPDTVRLELSDGDWILIKKQLSSGEQRLIFDRMVKSWTPEGLAVNPVQAQIARVVEYLIDWSLIDGDGQPVVIRGKSRDEIKSALDNLEPETFAEIETAINAHVAALEEEKKRPATASASSAT